LTIKPNISSVEICGTGKAKILLFDDTIFSPAPTAQDNFDFFQDFLDFCINSD